MSEEETQEDIDTPDEAVASRDREAFDSRLIVEGMLFSATKPLRIVDIEEATNLPRDEVRTALRRLSSDYRRRNTALEVTKVGGRWTMLVRNEFTPHARTVAAPEVDTKLLKTLALIAYHQPVLQSDLQEMMGPKVYDDVRSLVGLGLVTAARKGATKQLTTTHKFPEYFGIASAKREDIKKFMAERVGIEFLETRDMPEEAQEEAPEAAQAAREQVEGEQAEPVPGPEGESPGPEDDQR